jgi:hypothetical protein
MARFVARESVRPIRQLVQHTQEQRGEIWRLLGEEIELAFERRLEEVEAE